MENVMENRFGDRETYFATENNYGTRNFRQWRPVIYSPNGFTFGPGAVSPSTISSDGVETPLKYGEWNTFDDRFARALGQPGYVDGVTANAPSAADSQQNPRPGMGASGNLVPCWQPWGAEHASTYPQESTFVPKVEVMSSDENGCEAREWQRPSTNQLQKDFQSRWDNYDPTRACSTPEAEVSLKMGHSLYIQDSVPSLSQQEPWPCPTYNDFPKLSPNQTCSPQLCTSQLPPSRRETPTNTTNKTLRLTHSEVEKQYRTRLDNHFKILLAKIPIEVLNANSIETGVGVVDGRRKNITKADTLILARQYIRILRNEERELTEENRSLVGDMERLKGEWAMVGGVVMP